MYILTSTVMSQLSFGITDIPRSSQKGCSRLVSLLISSVHCITLNTHWSSSEQQLQWFSQAPMVLFFEFSSTIHLSLQGFGRHGARCSEPADISVCCTHLPFLSPCFFPLARKVPSRLRKRLRYILQWFAPEKQFHINFWTQNIQLIVHFPIL